MSKTATERSTEWRREKMAQGYRQKSFFLSPEALRALEVLGSRREGGERQAVEDALFLLRKSERD